MHRRVSALLKLGEILGIKKDEIMAFGDGSNDMDMIRRVGFGVAMENGIVRSKKQQTISL